MLKKTITFKDVDDQPITEEFHFNVSRSDLIDILVEKPELEEKLQLMATKMDGRAIMSLLKEFIILGVGKREEGGRKFVKNAAITDDFRYSGAYDSLYWELVNDPEAADKFLMGLFPSSMIEEIQKTGKIEDIQKQLAEGKTLGDITVNLPDKDWAAKEAPANPAFQELPNSGTIDTVEGEVVSDPRSPFPNSLPEAIAAQESTRKGVEDERPAWLREHREPTSEELRNMNPTEFQLAFKMKNEGKFAKQN
jgi:hypothetical protein